MTKLKVNKGKKETRIGEKRKKRTLEQNVDVETYVTVNNDVDHELKVMKGKKVKVSTGRKKKNKDKNVVVKERPEDEEVDLEELSGGRKKKNKDKNVVVKERPEDEEVDLEEQSVDHGMEIRKGEKVKVTTSRKRKNKDKNVVAKQRPEDEEVDLEEKSVDHGMKVGKGEKLKVISSRKRKSKGKNLVVRQRLEEEEVELKKENDGVVEHCDSEQEEVKDSKERRDSNAGAFIKPCRSKEAKKKRRKEVPKSPEKREQDHQDEIHIISSGDDDCSNGMKKWIVEYHQSRPGLEVLQQQIDDFVTDYEEKLEEEKKAKEALAAEGGWTVVVQRKGRKKTTDSESGIAVGSVAQAAVEDKLAKKKSNIVGLDFYRFQKREAQRNELMLLQSKFEDDKKRLQQLRAARKFRPY